MKAYAVCLKCYKKEMKVMEYFSTKEKAKACIDRISTKLFPNHDIIHDKEHNAYVCKIRLNNFYMGIYEDAYDTYYIDEITIQ